MIPRGGTCKCTRSATFWGSARSVASPARCGVSQPSLTNAIFGLEQELGGALFQRKPLIALTVLGHAVHPYFDRIAQNVDQAREAAEAMAVQWSTSMPLQPSGLS